jgi:hypothetical protein
MATVVIPFEIGWGRLAAEIAVDALIVHKVFTGDILRVFVFYICHIRVSFCLKLVQKIEPTLRNAITFLRNFYWGCTQRAFGIRDNVQ